MAERGKVEALLGNPAGAYLIFKSVLESSKETELIKQRKVAISERWLAKQLENE
jgi:hypothetical protein